MFVWDQNKSALNKLKHGLAFDAVHLFDWESTVIVDRSRHADGEARFAAIGMLSSKLHTVIFTRRGAAIRIISLRRANKDEEKVHAQKI